MNYDQASQQAYNQGQQAQEQLNRQSAQTQQQYQQQYGTAQALQNEQANYIRNIQEGGAQAQKYLQDTYKMLGIQPEAIQSANLQIAKTQAALRNTQQAAQQAGGGYGMTAGGLAQAQTNLYRGLENQLANQTAVSTQLSANLDQATKIASFVEQSQLATQEQKIKGYADVTQTATQLLGVASKTMNDVQKLAQDQGYVTAQQVQSYQTAKNQAAQAGAAAAAAEYSRQQAEGQRLANILLAQEVKLGQQNFAADQAKRDAAANKKAEASRNIIETKINPRDPNSPTGFSFRGASGQPVSAVQYSQYYDIPFKDLLGRMASKGDRNAQIAMQYITPSGTFRNVPEANRGSLQALGIGNAQYTQNYTKPLLGY